MPHWSVQYRAKDFVAAYQFLNRRLWAKLPYRWIVSLLGGLYGLLFFVALLELWKGVVTNAIHWGSWFVSMFAAAFFISLVIGPVTRALWRRGLLHMWGRNTDHDVITLDDKGITIEGEMGLTQVPWHKVDDIVEADGYVYFTYRRIACLYVPTYGFDTPAALEEFTTHAKEQLAKVQANRTAEPDASNSVSRGSP